MPPFVGLLLRLGDAGVYGDQLQPHGIDGVDGEATARVSYAERPGSFADGEPYSLRAPTYTIEAPTLGPLPANHTISPRVAPQMIGMCLLAAIPEADLLAAADPDDADGDGISGRANFVHDVATDTTVLGRFGWKANQPSVRQQVARRLPRRHGHHLVPLPRPELPPRPAPVRRRHHRRRPRDRGRPAVIDIQHTSALAMNMI